MEPMLNIHRHDLDDLWVVGKGYHREYVCQRTKGRCLVDLEISSAQFCMSLNTKLLISPEPLNEIGQTGARQKGLDETNQTTKGP